MSLDDPTFAAGDAADGLAFALAGETLVARPSGALWAPRPAALIVADLHLGKAERLARRGGALLPPYETEETLARLAAEIAALRPARILCLGDSFDDTAAARALGPALAPRLAAMAGGAAWVWVAGNHDPAPAGAPGDWLAEARLGPLTLRHIARPGADAELSGHFHPKARVSLRGRRIARRCFLRDDRRVILPAFGAYTGGLDATDAAFDALLAPGACALLTGRRVTAMPRAALG